MSLHPNIIGLLADSGRRYVRIQAESGSATLAYDAFSIANTKLANQLTAGGLPLFAKEDLETVIEEVRALSYFELGRIVEHPGWNGKSFVQHNGNVTNRTGPGLELLFRPHLECVRTRGSLSDWKKRVAQPLADHPIPAFAIMAMFLPPLLRFMPHIGNSTFELVGPSGKGKSIVQKLAASVVGPPSSVIGLRDVQHDLARVQSLSRDYPLLIDHVAPALATMSRTQKAVVFTAVEYDLQRAPGRRFTLLSGRQPLRNACNMPTQEDSIITLCVPDGSNGVFSPLPEESVGTEAIVDGLMAAANANHGVAFPAFLEKLHQDLLYDHKAVVAKLERLQARFLGLAAVQGGNGIDHRIVRLFAAIYAAGIFARSYKILPGRFPRKAIALAVLDIYFQARNARQPFPIQLENLVNSGKLLTITKGVDFTLQANMALASLGTLDHKQGKRIIKITPKRIAEAFPEWQRIKHLDEVRQPNGPLKLDGKNLTTWGKLAPGMDRIRLYQFVLPASVPNIVFPSCEIDAQSVA